MPLNATTPPATAPFKLPLSTRTSSTVAAAAQAAIAAHKMMP
jgi:hypothetical protein